MPLALLAYLLLNVTPVDDEIFGWIKGEAPGLEVALSAVVLWPVIPITEVGAMAPTVKRF